jgi:hypothetical protein
MEGAMSVPDMDKRQSALFAKEKGHKRSPPMSEYVFQLHHVGHGSAGGPPAAAIHK